MIRLLGYTPDINQTTPGAIIDCNGFVPSTKGMKGAPSPVTGTLSSALAAACIGSAVLRKLDNTTRFFAGTTTALYEGGATSWTDRTRGVGGAYTGSTDSRWRFTQFGDVSIATNKADTMQYSSSGAFANITGGIKASLVETAGAYIVAADTNEATYNDSPNRWWVTPNYADWTPSVANLIATGIITSAPGPIRAVKRFGDAVILYKEQSMHYGTFVGAPTVFDVRDIQGNVGAMNQEAVVSIGTPESPKHIFMGYDNFYQFDGSRPFPIGSALRETVFNDLNRSYFYRAQALHDRLNSRVYFFYPSASSNGSLDKCVVYNYVTQQWGRDDRTIESVVEYISASVTYDDLGTYFSTYGTSMDFSYDSPFFTASQAFPAIFNSSHIVQTLTGTPTSGYITTGDIGDEVTLNCLQRAQPRFLTKPTTATMTNYYRDQLGDGLTTGTTVNMYGGRFNVLREARWHRLRFNTTGAVEISDLRIDMEPAGEE